MTQQDHGAINGTSGAAEHEYDVPVKMAPARLAFGWLLVGVPLIYGVITTLSRVSQLFQ